MVIHKNLVSIIIPSFNSLNFLNEAIDSALNQTYKHIEIILIDDGSTDGTANHFANFTQHGIKCVSQENSGASSARNHGLDLASGEYIQFLDADDLLHPEKIKRQVEIMTNTGADLSFVGWGNFKYDPKHSHKFKFRDIDFSELETGLDIFRSLGKEGWYIPTLSWLTKRELIIKAGYWNPSICPNDDGEFFSRVLFWSKNVKPIKYKLAYYRVSNENSLSKLNTVHKIQASITSWEQITSLLKSLNDDSLMYYPKKSFHYLYRATSKKNPELSKVIERNFNSINVKFINKNKNYSYFINRFGLKNGLFFYKIAKKIKIIW